MRWRNLSFAAICIIGLCSPRATLATDFQAEYDRLDKKIGKELGEPIPSPKHDVGPYVYWLQVKAADRARANALALEAGEQNPYFQKLFGDLAQDAQMSGNSTVDDGARMLIRWDEANDDYATPCFRIERYGKSLWEATIANGFDREIIRERVRRAMRFSINNLDNHWLWVDLESRTVAEAQGHMIEGDFEDVYLPRSAFVRGSKHALMVNPYVDEWLAEVEKCVRKPCEFFGLIGIRDTEATPMMEEYLQDTLCLKQDIGHKHYLELAEQYQLNNARKYVDGFYAKLHGHVWIEEEEGHRRPASGAKVKVVDPRDGETWDANADADGKYEIEKGLLHNHKGKDDENRCPVFEISAEHQGDRVDDTYEGPLREPDRNAEHIKDLVIQHDRWELEIEYHEQVAYDNRDVRSDGNSTVTMEEHITGTLDYRITATLKPASWQPADALRPYQTKEEEARAQFAQPRPDYVPSTTGEQLEKIEREEAQVRQRANEVAGPGGMHYVIALGVGIQLKDDFVHTKNVTIVSRNGRIEDDRRWEWHADQQGPIPLNVQLKTYANQGTYDITLTHHDPMAMGNPETAQPFGIPWRYLARHTLNGQAELNCSGTAEVEPPGNYPHNVFVHVPENLLVYDGSQRVLSGEHSWTESVSQLDVSRTETPGCAERRALGNFNRALPNDSVTKTLKWTLRRLGGPSGP